MPKPANTGSALMAKNINAVNRKRLLFMRELLCFLYACVVFVLHKRLMLRHCRLPGGMLPYFVVIALNTYRATS